MSFTCDFCGKNDRDEPLTIVSSTIAGRYLPHICHFCINESLALINQALEEKKRSYEIKS